MKPKTAVVMGLCCLCAVVAIGQEAEHTPTDSVAPNIPGVVAAGAKIQVFKIAATGNTEGPVALPDGSLIFTEQNASRLWKIDKDNKVSVFLDNTSGSLGQGFDSKGRLIAALTAPPGKTTVKVIYPKGQEAVLADTCDGKPLGRPNDLVVGKNGGVYFTDPGPNAGQIKQGYTPTSPQVCYIPPGGKAIKVADVMGRPNGIQLSPDEKTLYVNNSFGEYMLAFDVQPDGTVRNRRNFGKYRLVPSKEAGPVSVSDGMAVDAAGRVYTTNQSVFGIQVFSPQGQDLGLIQLTGDPQNVAFAGPDKKTLYVTGGGWAYKVSMLAEGFKGRAK